MDYNDNANFAGMYAATEIRFDGIARLIKSLYTAVHTHVVMMPSNPALRTSFAN